MLTWVSLADEAQAQPPRIVAAPAIPLCEKEKSGSLETSLLNDERLARLRAAACDNGLSYSFDYVGEVLANTAGGIKRGATYEGRLEGALSWKPADTILVRGTFEQIHGRGLTSRNLVDLFGVSGFEADASSRLFEATFEANLAKTLAVRAGQMALDTAFVTSETASLFYNSSLGPVDGFLTEGIHIAFDR